MEQFENQPVALIREGGIVAVPLIAHEGVGAIHFEPLKIGFNFVKASLDAIAAVERNVRILATPDVQQLALDVGRAGERVILFAFA